MFYVYAWLICTFMDHTCAWWLWMPQEGIRFPRTVTTGGCEPPRRCWEPNPGPLQEQQVLLMNQSHVSPAPILLNCETTWNPRWAPAHSVANQGWPGNSALPPAMFLVWGLQACVVIPCLFNSGDQTQALPVLGKTLPTEPYTPPGPFSLFSIETKGQKPGDRRFTLSCQSKSEVTWTSSPQLWMKGKDETWERRGRMLRSWHLVSCIS